MAERGETPGTSMAKVSFDDAQLLFRICESGSDERAVEDVRRILDPYKSSIDFKTLKNSEGKTPLHIAAFEGNLEIVKTLVLRYGADPEEKDEVRTVYMGTAHDVRKFIDGMNGCREESHLKNMLNSVSIRKLSVFYKQNEKEIKAVVLYSEQPTNDMNSCIS